MAHTKSTIKRIKQAKKRRLRNIGVKSGVKTVIKKFQTVLEEGDKKALKATLSETFKVLDQAASKGIIKKATADRRKSRLSLQARAKLG